MQAITASMTTADQSAFAMGDVVFIQIDNYLFRQVADASNSWVNHVGVIVDHDGRDFVIAESTIPRSKLTPLDTFIGRSKNRRFAVRRLSEPLTRAQQSALYEQAVQRLGRFYHTGFKLASRRQFCSKFVHEVYRDALGLEIGKVETFADLLQSNPQARLGFWRLWFGGLIPWQRKTVTPTSEYLCTKLVTAFETSI